VVGLGRAAAALAGGRPAPASHAVHADISNADARGSTPRLNRSQLLAGVSQWAAATCPRNTPEIEEGLMPVCRWWCVPVVVVSEECIVSVVPVALVVVSEHALHCK
jgi:hypothetical protein